MAARSGGGNGGGGFTDREGAEEDVLRVVPGVSAQVAEELGVSVQDGVVLLGFVPKAGVEDAQEGVQGGAPGLLSGYVGGQTTK